MRVERPHEIPRRFEAAINAGDLPSALALWAEEAAIVAADGSALAGRDAIAGALAALIDHGTRVQIEVVSLYEAAGSAVASGSVTFHARDGSSHRSSAVAVYRREGDGCWRMAIDAPWGLPA